MPQKLGSISYHLRPWRAETGCAWWLLCQPSPPVSKATNQLLVESSRVSKRRDPHMWVAELTSQVTCIPTVTRRKTPHSTQEMPHAIPLTPHPPKAAPPQSRPKPTVV